MRLSRPRGRAAVFCAALLLPLTAAAATKRVEVPLVIPPAFLERLLVEQVFTEPGTRTRVVAVADPCSEIVLSEPSLRPRGDRISVSAHGRAWAGFTILGYCLQPFDWEGEVDVEQEPRLARDVPAVEFQVVNSRLLDPSNGPGVSDFWDWVKPAVHPRLEILRVDLEPLLRELRRTLPLFTAQPEEPGVRRLADSLGLASVRVEQRGLVLGVVFDVETRAEAPLAAELEPPLTPEEITAFEAELHEWDAFITFVIGSAGREALDPALRATLLEVLLEARYEIVAALAEPGRDGEKRVRALFQSSWGRLQPALAPLTGGQEGLRYLAFVAAGDALHALDQAAPAFGVDLSSDGLRRLARTLAPQASGDVLRWSEEVDPQLRETFGFDVELPALPVLPPPEDEAAPGPAPDPMPLPSDEPAPEPGAALRSLPALAARLARSFWPAAFAAPAQIVVPTPESSPLDGLVPRRADLDDYLPRIGELLREASREVLSHGRLEREYDADFERLVLATAWQESCWRQYVERSKKRVPIRSSVGALGIMQVNPRVWRGFFSVDGLSWSIRYNAVAGGEVLLHYLSDYAIARGEAALGGPDALARATYGAYHGGPSHLRRYREPKRWRGALVAVDRAFHAKYRALASDAGLGVRECFPG